MSGKRTYLGRCHCGAVRFRLVSEAITQGKRCNCSICVRKGAVMSVRYFTPDEIRVEGGDALAVYQWGDKLVNHWFCRTCGIYTFHDATEMPGHYRVNLGCIDEIDPLSLAIELVDGRAF
jgi:hypothetical protein